jgi:ribosome-associated protein
MGPNGPNRRHVRNTQPQDRIHPDFLDHAGRPRFDALEGARAALEAALDKKALEPVLLDVRALCSYTEYILMVSGRSDRQVDAIADAVNQALKGLGRRAIGVEGVSSGQWALLDFGDLVVHVFLHPVRMHYDLESLWHEAPRVAIDVPEEARATPDDLY